MTRTEKKFGHKTTDINWKIRYRERIYILYTINIINLKFKNIMKKLSIFVMSLAMAALTFTSCEKGGQQGPNLDDVIEDGFYCVGPATAVESITAKNLSIGLMGQGTNEAEKEANGGKQVKRAGMYEKYVALEADKEFSLVLHKEGKSDVVYGADLEETDAISDNAEITIKQFKGQLKQDKTMKVAKSGLYHIILDLDEDGKLSSMGGAQIVLIPCEWGVRGDLNSWGYTAMEQATFDKTKMVYTMKDVEVKKDGSFKFAHSHCWKFNLDMSGAVKAENSIGTDADEDGGAYKELLAGGKNIPLARGIYTITLTWELKGGAMAKSFAFEAKKTGEPAVDAFDPASKVVGISGTVAGCSWGDPAGLSLAKYNAEKSEITDQATKAGNYVYEIKGMTFAADNLFKFRFDGDWIGFSDVEIEGVTASQAETDGNITGVVGCYDIAIIVGWDGAQRKSLKAVFTPGTPSEVNYVNIAVSAVVPDDWTKCYVWAWDDNGNIFAEWPGEELEIKEGKVTRQFDGVANALNLIFSNGAGAQTNDLKDVKDGAEIDIQANLK